jgi:hypothetical protein
MLAEDAGQMLLVAEVAIEGDGDRQVAEPRRCFARATRRRVRYWCGAIPTARLNCRAKKWTRLKPVTPAAAYNFGLPMRWLEALLSALISAIVEPRHPSTIIVSPDSPAAGP